MRRLVSAVAGAALALLSIVSIPLVAQAPAAGPSRDDAPEEWYLPVGDGCRLYVYELGRGRDTLVILHGGFGAEHGYLLDAFAGLEGAYRLVFYDQRGSLRSPCPDSSISVAKHVADLERLRDELKLERMTLVGHSTGTFLAMRYLQDHSGKVRGLVLLSATTPASPSTPADSAAFERGRKARTEFFDRPAIAEQLRREGLDKNPAQMSAKERTRNWRIRVAGGNLYHVDRWRQIKGGQVFYNPSAGAAAVRTVPQTVDLRPALAAHRCQTSFISGDHDLGDTASVLRHMLASVPNVQLDVIANAGHHMWLDAPEQFRRLLLAALDRAATCP